MSTITHNVYLPNTQIIDPLGSIIVNTNTTLSPLFSWVYPNQVKAVGTPDFSSPISSSFQEFKNVSSWKIKYLENIPKYNSSGYIGSSACLTSPSSPSCEGGPYKVFGKKYYIDFFVVYIVNTSVVPPGDNASNYYISGPIVAVDPNYCSSSYTRCHEDYGIFLAVPRVLASSTTYPTATDQSVSGNDVGMLSSDIEYTNQLKFNTNISYRLTVLNSSGNFMDNITLTTNNILTALENAILYGQTSVSAVKSDGSGVLLYPQPSTFPSSYDTRSYYPVVIFRYISENSLTTRVNLTFSISVSF